MTDQTAVASMARTRELVTAALLTALISASAWVSIPLPSGVPVTLQIFFVVLSALLLTPGWAFASMGGYVLLGAAGLPVFAGAKGGLGVLAGPTGGYLVGFAVGALLGAFFRGLLERAGRPGLTADAVAAAVVVVCVYVIGTVQLSIVLGLSPVAAIAAGVAPYILGDVLKAAAAVAAAVAIRRARG